MNLALNLLIDPLIRAVSVDGSEGTFTLPGVLAELALDRIVTFPGIRAHQRHAWHAFLCQVGALALLENQQSHFSTDEAEWRAMLRHLTPRYDDDAPWSLVSPPDRPALLQPPAGPFNLTKTMATPDALDMLVTSRNHDLKGAVMTAANADDWLFALLTLQTMEGFLGAGNYGISRMNGGFASRPALSVAPRGDLGAQFRRDVTRLLALRGKLPGSMPYAASGGHALLWLLPWDGTASLHPEALDELYVEVCRRIRLVERNGRLFALSGSSQVARVAGTAGGLTGDAWAPLVADGAGRKVFTITATGFNYQRMVNLMWPAPGSAAPLQTFALDDDYEGITLVGRALARGSGKTEGYHERHVQIPCCVSRMTIEMKTGPLAAMAKKRVEIAGQVGRVLRTALLVLFQGGPKWVNEHNKDGLRKAQPFLDRFNVIVDRRFFNDLWCEAEASDETAALTARMTWTKELLSHAEKLLEQADYSAPKATRRRLKARVRAEGALQGLPFHNPVLSLYCAKASDAS